VTKSPRLKFVRFVANNTTPLSGKREGVLQLANTLKKSGDLPTPELIQLTAALDWLDTHLPTPSRFNRTTSKGSYRRETAGLSWLKDSATDAIERIWIIVNILNSHGHHVSMLTTDRPGYIVFEDVYQIVAEPFADTPT